MSWASSRKYILFYQIHKANNYRRSVPAKLNVGHRAVHGCTAGNIVPTHQALWVLAEATHETFAMKMTDVSYFLADP